MTYEQVEEILDKIHVLAAEKAKAYGIPDSAAFKGGYFAMVIESVVKALPSDAQVQFKHRVEELIDAAK